MINEHDLKISERDILNASILIVDDLETVQIQEQQPLIVGDEPGFSPQRLFAPLPKSLHPAKDRCSVRSIRLRHFAHGNPATHCLHGTQANLIAGIALPGHSAGL